MDPWKGQRISEESNDANAVDEVWRSPRMEAISDRVRSTEYKGCNDYNHLHVRTEFRSRYH
jgi:hypothetical protein